MSQENVDVVRQIYSAFNDHRVDAIPGLCHPDFAWYPNPEDPEREARHGYEEATTFLEAQWKVLPGLHTEIEEMIDAGSAVVVVALHTARVPGSDSEIERREAHVWSLREGKAATLWEYPNREQAFEAAGLLRE